MLNSIFKTGVLWFFLLLASLTCMAKVKLPAIFGDQMVLQQKNNVALWGKAKASTIVTIYTSWNKKSYTIKSKADSTWKIKVVTPSAGGPYTISFSDGEK
jgi:sialate O-acetylesterase